VYDSAQSGAGTKYGSGYIYEYGNEVDYSWGNNSSSIKYSYGANKKGTHSGSSYGTYGFNYYDNTTTSSINWISKAFNKAGDSIGKVKSTYYYYYPETLTDSSSKQAEGALKTSSDVYNTLFCDSNNQNAYYWLASPYAYTSNGYVDFGLRFVFSGLVSGDYLVDSYGDLNIGGYGVRAVVTLGSNAIIDTTGKTGTDKDNAYAIK
jgi:hypothetical protein